MNWVFIFCQGEIIEDANVLGKPAKDSLAGPRGYRKGARLGKVDRDFVGRKTLSFPVTHQLVHPRTRRWMQSMGYVYRKMKTAL